MAATLVPSLAVPGSPAAGADPKEEDAKNAAALAGWAGLLLNAAIPDETSVDLSILKRMGFVKDPSGDVAMHRAGDDPHEDRRHPGCRGLQRPGRQPRRAREDLRRAPADLLIRCPPGGPPAGDMTSGGDARSYSSVLDSLTWRVRSTEPLMDADGSISFDVEYGPVRGAWPSDVRKMFERAVARSGSSVVFELDVAHYPAQADDGGEGGA